jgi:hypothetical protein
MMSVDHRTPEQKVRAMLAARGLPQNLFSGARLLEQQEADRLRFVPSCRLAAGLVVNGFGRVVSGTEVRSE